MMILRMRAARSTLTIAAIVLIAATSTSPAAVRMSPRNAEPEPVSVTVNQAVDDEGDNLTISVFEVPAGKILRVNYVTMYMDVVVGGRPMSGLRILGSVSGVDPGATSSVRFQLGYMEEFPLTSRGTPNFVLSSEAPVYFGEGFVACHAQTFFGGVNLSFGSASCSLSGELMDAPAR